MAGLYGRVAHEAVMQQRHVQLPSGWGAAVPAALHGAANETPRESTALPACLATLPAAKHPWCWVSFETPCIHTVCTALAMHKHVPVLPSPVYVFYIEKETPYFPPSY